VKFGGAVFRKGEQICVLVRPDMWEGGLVLVCTCSGHGEFFHKTHILEGVVRPVITFLGEEWYLLWDHLGEQPKEERDPKLALLCDLKKKFGGQLAEDDLSKIAPRKRAAKPKEEATKPMFQAVAAAAAATVTSSKANPLVTGVTAPAPEPPKKLSLAERVRMRQTQA
jgi:hypothetical protein